jgi:superfamily II DNA helicase RecQ
METNEDDPFNEEFMIRNILNHEWNVTSPRDMQINAIKYICFPRPRLGDSRRCLALIEKTGSGKSLVSYGASTFLEGISIILPPLKALQFDQFRKLSNFHNLTVVYNTSMEKEKVDRETLRRRLLNCKREAGKSFILLMSPGDLAERKNEDSSKEDDPFWRDLVADLAKEKLIRLVVLDEADKIPLQGRVFRREMESVKALMEMLDKHQKGVAPILVMSATLPAEVQKDFTDYTGIEFTEVQWGRMDRREIKFEFDIEASTLIAIKKKLDDYIAAPETKSIVFTPYQARVVEMRSNISEHKFGSEHADDSIEEPYMVQSLHGGTGTKEKQFLTDLFSNETESDFGELDVLVANMAAECSISSKNLKLCVFEGFPSSWIAFVQIMGRLARALRDGRNELPDKFVVVVSFDRFLKHIKWIGNNVKAEFRQVYHERYLEVAYFLVFPDMCYHVKIEILFENPDANRVREPCGECPFCNEFHEHYTQNFRRQELIDALDFLFNDGPVEHSKVLAALRRQKDKIWTVRQSKVTSKHLHALVLQLVLKGIIDLNYSDCKLKWKKDRDTLVYKDMQRWAGFDCSA